MLESLEDSETANERASAFIDKNRHIRGGYNVSAGSTKIAQSHARLSGLADLVHVTHELTESQRQLLKQGSISAIIDQNLATSSRRAVGLLANLFGRQQALTGESIVPLSIILRENC